ncbi:ATP-binding cassette domain-containing protein [Roseibacterium sp. SDUM158017]|uniref:thiamine ABC transporter ATP-binding protein n=1 Tax=Roseicyclus salinarum TaxID=3036773 RepID=UPI002414ECB4|nr:ATP-binding cassette domain-containing protein [Roseibacterium sp. SDUM158017]MDG4647095.1 ATP-binding cassette domain-containing protein [Roseibacterium sp. SDUM158017]
MLRLDDVDLRLGDFRLSVATEIAPGERVAILGASGSGKSTLLSLLAGFHAPDRGRILWGGRDLTAMPPAARPMSILFQDGNLFPHLTVAQNVGLALRTDLRIGAAEVARVRETLRRVGLGGMEDRRPADLSGGQQGRAALARVLLQDRPVALLDEPFSALDPALRTGMLGLLQDLWREHGMTFLMATHDLRDAERLCDRLWLLDEGKVVLDRAVEGVRDDAPDVLRDWF